MGGQGLFSWMVMEQAGRKRLAIINGKNEMKFSSGIPPRTVFLKA